MMMMMMMMKKIMIIFLLIKKDLNFLMNLKISGLITYKVIFSLLKLWMVHSTRRMNEIWAVMMMKYYMGMKIVVITCINL
ncbi:hypothetical protein NC651_001918 [Populus alba x Populus x berolinensis]|nr:hypothetical protein NC651_001918 [Populus alba x Populus x berolinensis]